MPETVRLLHIDVERNFRNCGLFNSEPWTTIAWDIARIIIRDGAISKQEYYSLFKDYKRAQELLMGNVFTLQPRQNIVTFDCKIAEVFAKKELQFRSDRFRWGPGDWLVGVWKKLLR